MKMRFYSHDANHGFSLIELAIVLLIVTLLLGGLLVPLSAQIDLQRAKDTDKTLLELRDVLIGYAIMNSRLPCPASDTSNGEESFDTAGGDASNGKCSNYYDGFIPAATLGYTNGVDSNGRRGYAIDAWGNRIHYAVTKANTQAFTKLDGMKTTGISSLSPDLLVCTTATAITPTSCNGNALTSSPGVPALIFSMGKNGSYGGTSADELANLDGTNSNSNRTFVSHTPTPSPNEFDDLVIWISPGILINRMVTAGKLP